jgi:hypothetical protein
VFRDVAAGAAVRGKILPLTNRQVVERAMSMVGYKPVVAGLSLVGQYCMKAGRNGGADPSATHPFTVWKHPKKGTVASADCVGFGMWAQGADRLLEGLIHDYEGGWVNTDSALMDAAGDRELFEECEPFPGCAVVYPSRWEERDGEKNHIPGHWGTVVTIVPAARRAKALIQVAHCHGPPLSGPAISLGDAAAWLKHGGKFLRFKVARD